MSSPYRTAAAPARDWEEPVPGAYWAERSTGLVVVLIYEMPTGWWCKELNSQAFRLIPWADFREELWWPYLCGEVACA